MFLIGTAYYNMAFGVSLAVLFPVFAKDVLGVGPEGLGFMWGAMGVGSVAGSVHRVEHDGGRISSVRC